MGRAKQRRPPSEENLEREARALQLRIAGASFEKIAQVLGMSNRSVAFKAYERALSRVHAENANQMREIGSARLDTLLTAVWGKAVKGDLAAVDRVLKIEERRARLFGLDSPTRLSIDAATLGEEIGRLLDSLGGPPPPVTVTGDDEDDDDDVGDDDGPGEP